MTTVLVVGVAVLAVIALGAMLLRGSYPRAEVERLLLAGRYDEAASVAMRHERLEEAADYYLRADKPARAAHLHARLGQPRQAAELYERAGELLRAAHQYEQAGMKEKAEELRRRGPSAGQLPGGPEPTVTPAAAEVPAAPAAAPTEPPSLAQQAEVDFRAARATVGRGEADQARVREMAREAAEALLGAGEIARAADVYRDGGLDEEAIHLYVNVLGAPAEAAPLLAAAGNHERAAELYELAGDKERAATAWATAARYAPDPERYADRIQALREAAAGGGSGRKSWLPGGASAHEGELELDIAAADLDSLAREVARSAQQRAKGGDLLSQLAVADQEAAAGAAAIPQSEAAGVAPALVVGLEQVPIALELLVDAGVRAARGGPSRESLERFIGGRACDLQNIEVYFRLGLAQLGAGQWEAALTAFEAVEEASPGYRDAWQRAEEIRGWQKALGARTVVGPDGRYALRGELFRGPMAVVYRATDRVLGREVALKVMAAELGDGAGAQELFERQASALAQLNHPNIVAVYDYGALEGRLFLSREYVEGRSMERTNLASERPPIVEVLRAARQVLDALAYAHGRQILHGGVEPAKVIRTTTGLVKLMDFGLTRSGRPAYSAPEQLRGEPVDARADLFSAGVFLYELLTGQLPFEGSERQAPPPRPRSIVPSIPEVLDDAVGKALALDPADRFQSAAEFAKPLRSILEKVDRRVTAVGMAAVVPSPTQYSGPPPVFAEETVGRPVRGPRPGR